MADTTRFNIRFAGSALERGTMDVRDLSRALLAVAGALQAANRRLNGDQAEMRVEVRADFQRGSFGVDLETSHTVMRAIQQMLHSDNFTTAQQLVELIFGKHLSEVGIAGGVVGGIGGVIALVKKLKGRKPDTVKEAPGGEVRVSVGNTSFTVNGNVYNIYTDNATRTELAEMVRPLEKAGIDSIAVTTGGDEPAVTIDKTEAAYFAESSADVDATNSSGEQERLLAIVKLSFNDRHKWTFSDGDGTINALILDDEFLGRVHKHEMTFGDGDILRVRLRWETTATSEAGLQTTYEVRRVLEVIPRGSQPRLPLKPTDPPEGDE